MTYDLENEVRRRTRRVSIIAALVVAAVAAAAGVVVWRSGTAPHSRQAAAPAASASAPASGPAPSGAESAGPGDLGALSWMDVRGMEVPVSARSGPARLAGGRAAGFSHDLPGAVLAAVHLTVRADAIVGPAVFEPTIRQQVVGVDADNLAAAVDADYETRWQAAGVDPGSPLPETHAAVTGYRIESTTGDDVFLRLLAESPGRDAQGTVYVDFRIEVRWLGGDWRLVAPPGGNWANATGQVTSRTGYVLLPARR